MAELNPYASPKTHLQGTAAYTYVTSSNRNRCPVCDGFVDPWKVGNSIRFYRCPKCNSLLWMGTSTWLFVLCMSLPFVWIGVCQFFLPRSAIGLGIALFGVFIPFSMVYIRIIFGHPVAMRPEAIEKLDTIIDQDELSTNKPVN